MTFRSNLFLAVSSKWLSTTLTDVPSKNSRDIGSQLNGKMLYYLGSTISWMILQGDGKSRAKNMSCKNQHATMVDGRDNKLHITDHQKDKRKWLHGHTKSGKDKTWRKKRWSRNPWITQVKEHSRDVYSGNAIVQEDEDRDKVSERWSLQRGHEYQYVEYLRGIQNRGWPWGTNETTDKSVWKYTLHSTTSIAPHPIHPECRLWFGDR